MSKQPRLYLLSDYYLTGIGEQATLREGSEETLTVMRLNLSQNLARVLS